MDTSWAVPFALCDGICNILRELTCYLEGEVPWFPDDLQMQNFRDRLGEFEERVNDAVDKLKTVGGLSYCSRGDLFTWRGVMKQRFLIRRHILNVDLRDYRDELVGASSSLAFTTKHMGHDNVSEEGLVANAWGPEIAAYAERAERNPWALDYIDLIFAERMGLDYPLSQVISDFEESIKNGHRGLQDMYKRHLAGSLCAITSRYWIPEIRRF